MDTAEPPYISLFKTGFVFLRNLNSILTNYLNTLLVIRFIELLFLQDFVMDC